MKSLLNVPVLLTVLLGGSILPVSAAYGQDVSVYSAKSADAMLNAPVEEEHRTNTCSSREIMLDDGSCIAVKKFSIARMGSPSSSVARPAAQFVPGTPRKPVGRRPVAAATSARDVPLQFMVGSSELSPQSRVNLATLAKVLVAPAHGDKRIRIVGHTDRSGSRSANLALSQARADAVAAYLTSQGVASDRIDTLGVADTVMVAGYSPFSGRQRRVEIARTR